jgi:hypothetical protein
MLNEGENLNNDSETKDIENPSSENNIKELLNSVLYLENRTLSSTSKSSLLILKKSLLKSMIDLDIAQIIEIFKTLEELELKPDVLESTRLPRILKYFADNYKGSENDALNSLAKIAKFIYFKWKNLITCQELSIYDIGKEKVHDPELREKVHNKVVEILMENGFDGKESERLARSIENNIRKRDPSMKEVYQKLVKRMIRDIRTLDKRAFAKLEALQIINIDELV